MEYITSLIKEKKAGSQPVVVYFHLQTLLFFCPNYSIIIMCIKVDCIDLCNCSRFEFILRYVLFLWNEINRKPCLLAQYASRRECIVHVSSLCWIIVFFECEDCLWGMTAAGWEAGYSCQYYTMYSLLVITTVLSNAFSVMTAISDVVFYFVYLNLNIYSVKHLWKKLECCI